MDKVKQILQQLRKYHFWILCVVAAIIGLLGWYMSTGKLEAEFAASSSKIDVELKKLTDITGEPRDSWKDYAAKRSAEAGKSVNAARDKIYKQQKEEVFVWRKELGDDFLDAVAKLEGTNDQLPIDLRERYLDWVKHAVDPLAKTVDAAAPDEPLAPPPADPAEAPPEHKVSWPQLATIQQTFDWEQRPSTLLIKYAQEELWVYQALCDVIAKLNEGASGAYNASVQEITSMDIAYLAIDAASKAATKGRIQSIAAAPGVADAAAAPAADPNAVIAKPDPFKRGTKDPTAAPTGDAAAAAANPDDLLKTYRYVNEKGEPITTASEAAQEYSMMPFRLLLKMDRRSVDKLLLACRNSKLPIEIQQVRINPGSTTAVGGGGFMGGGGGGGGGGREHGGREERGGAGGGGGGAVLTTGKPYDRIATVEVRGVVYIIQPEAKKPAAAAVEGDASGEAPAQENAAPPAEPDGAPAAGAKAEG